MTRAASGTAAVLAILILVAGIAAASGPAGGPSPPDTATVAKKKKKKCKKGFVRKKVKGKKKCVKKKTPAPVTSTPPPSTLAPVEYNSCANPYWTHTIRCQVFPDQAPQPNLDSAPASTTEVKDYTRVFLDADPSVRSVDGTIPIIYVDKAVCTLPGGCATPGGTVALGDPIDSDKWVISMTGGGSCTPPDVVAEGGGSCFDTYEFPLLGNLERGEMTTATDPAMKNIGADETNPASQGVHNPDPSDNPVFAGYNRIRVEKSTYDRYIGRAVFEAPGGFYHDTVTETGAPADYDLYQQGFRVMEETLEKLEDGLTYTTWHDPPPTGDAVEETTEPLPPLKDAEQVLFVGHSGGAHGLYNSIDGLHELVDTMSTGGDVDVRALFDANFLPSPENEAFFNTPSAGDMYDRIYTGTTTTTENGGMFSYDGADLYRDGHLAAMYDNWQMEPDASCMEEHLSHMPTTDEWQCVDRMHLLFNHISTPFFVREDFTDTNTEHTAGGTGHSVQWGPQAMYAHCAMGTNCFPRFTVTPELRDRHLKQISTLINESSTNSELATGADPSFTPGTPGDFPSFYAWMPSCGSHEGAYKEYSYNGTSIAFGPNSPTVHSMRQWLQLFVSETTLADRQEFRIHGYPGLPGGNQMASSCPP